MVKCHTKENFQEIRYHKTTGDQKSLTGRLNTVTREVMMVNSEPVIAVKCFFILTFVSTLGLFVREGYYLAQLVIVCVKTFFTSIGLFFKDLRTKGIIGNFYQRIVVDLFGGLATTLILTLCEMARVVYYSIGINLAAGSGLLFDPLKARERVGLIEKKLNRGKSPKDKREESESFTRIEPMYFAPCMQPWCNMNDMQADGTTKKYTQVTTS